MAFLNGLEQIDIALFRGLNQWNSPFFDHFFSLFTTKEMWVPFYLVLLFVFIRKFKKNSLWVILFLVLAIVAADQVSGFIKDGVARFRPTHNPQLAQWVHNTYVGPGGNYGFVSSHAANAFALFAFARRVFKQSQLTVLLLVWAVLTSYSRIYVGVHFPLDVICGGLIGGGFGWGAYVLLSRFDVRVGRKEISKAQFHIYNDSTYLISNSLVFTTVVLMVVSYVLLKFNVNP